MCVNRFHKIVVGQVTGLDGIVYEVMFIAIESEEGREVVCYAYSYIVCIFQESFSLLKSVM